MYEREIKERILRVAKSFRVLVVTGPRQVGKSTLLKSLMPEDMTYVTLDDEKLRQEAKENPRLFLENYKKPLYIDEVQYAPELFPYIKMIVDNDNSRGQYWLSGSQTFELMKNVSESLAGRVSILEMSSLSYVEKRGINSKIFNPKNIKCDFTLTPQEVFEEIYKGGMPEYISDNLDRNQFFNDYVLTYLERDVRNLTQVGDLNRFRKFM